MAKRNVSVLLVVWNNGMYTARFNDYGAALEARKWLIAECRGGGRSDSSMTCTILTDVED